ERRDHTSDTALRSEGGVPRDVPEQADRREREAADRERVAQRDSEKRVEVRLRLRAARVEVRVPRHGPERACGESEVEQAVPDGPELAERAVLQVDVIPAVEEEASDEGCREEARDHVLAPDRLRSHTAPSPPRAFLGSEPIPGGKRPPSAVLTALMSPASR